jgi:hypothetical protein
MSLTNLYSKAKEKNTFIVGKCVVGQWAATFDEPNLQAFNDSINDDDFSTRSLFDLYKNAGATFGLTSLRAHRNGECGCR